LIGSDVACQVLDWADMRRIWFCTKTEHAPSLRVLGFKGRDLIRSRLISSDL